ncbi:AAA family ATPase [Planosporangium thailandense]|uniref:AAA family ATPase n=1 Tax=Planosporangium thailandense TaxID=765197 RepID=A0ABX0Y6E7_9ACTN|nr:AAA domain-containing protein [Planosporangium thailandense]NJC73013.1 AAA family ATPase [Planosporangium thailandense]
MVANRDAEALRKTTKLMDYLAEVTAAAERDPVRDILADEAGVPDPIIWLDGVPDGVRLVPNPRDDVLLRLRPQRPVPAPSPAALLKGWVEPEVWDGEGPAPQLLDLGPTTEAVDLRTEPPSAVVRAFEAWSSQCRSWAREQEKTRRRRALYEQLEQAAKTLEQQDDEFEFVLAVGLLRWDAPDGERICRHLVTETVVPKLDRATAEVSVSFAGGRRRLEEREVLGDQEGFQPDRGRPVRQSVLDGDVPMLDSVLMTLLQEWVGYSLDVAVEFRDERVPPGRRLPGKPLLTASPALMVRPRSRVLLAEAYQKIAAALRQPDAQVPVALAQLVVDTERDQRDTWLRQQGAVAGDVLGDDPLFPLPTNDEQRRVIELLRSETGVVVQGPPGTGKTHTIANLVSALLARGQRVLVTSQKDQALRVLRDKIPPQLRQLCVLLAGGSKDAAKELERGLDALSAAVAAPDTAGLGQRITALIQERHALRSRSAELNERIRELRDVEHAAYEPLVPGFSPDRYRGSLGEIVREVRRDADVHGWFPRLDAQAPDQPPLSTAEALDLLRLLRTDTPVRQARARQSIPEPADLPLPAALADSFTAERQARATANENTSELIRWLTGTGRDALRTIAPLSDQVTQVLARLGFDEQCRLPQGREWVGRAVEHHLAGRHAGLWGHLVEVGGEARRLQQALRVRGVSFVVELSQPVSELGVGAARGMLAAGRELHAHLARGGKLRTGRLLPQPAVQQRAAGLLATMRVDGQPPSNADQLAAALEYLEAEVAATQLVQKWADAQVDVPPGRLTAILSELQDLDRILEDVRALAVLHGRLLQVLRQAGRPVELPTLAEFLRVLRAVPPALDHAELELARTQVDQLYARVRQWASNPDACPELGLLLDAIGSRDLDAYRRGLQAIEAVRADRAAQLRQGELAGRLEAVHPRLLAMLRDTATDAAWDGRLGNLAAAWAWSKADQLIRQCRTADEERRLIHEFDEVEDQITRVTAQLAGCEAMRACITRMTDNHVRALRTYREHMGHIGAGTGRKTREFRKAARAAMEKAKGAVPAWVVPLPNLLDNIAVERDAFDVIIVDEASQVGLEYLFLLWMAPRVIVVGDDKQCTPGQNRMGQNLDDLFASLREHLDDLEAEIRLSFTPKSHLYGLLSGRSGKGAVVRLREHFRCMPEIINWSSCQFYGEDGAGLVALRERRADDLEPLRVVNVAGAYTDGRNTTIRNPVEAKRIVAQLLDCLADPRYDDKTFGIVVLQGTGQIKLLEHEINAAISPEERGARAIRVGSPPNFQGDERDVIFLSTVVTQAPVTRADPRSQQAYNVAASRAKDQMWLFTSVPPGQFKPGDLRASLVDYMLHPPSVYGESPALTAVSATERVDPFESLFEQRVFREIRARGYHVVPQFSVGQRRLDLVIVGAGGRIAVECDGHRWHTSTADSAADARRDRELRRMGWEVRRIRESEFEFDPERELAPLWQRLAERSIHPASTPTPAQPTAQNSWHPIDLPADDAEGDDL